MMENIAEYSLYFQNSIRARARVSKEVLMRAPEIQWYHFFATRGAIIVPVAGGGVD